MIYEGIKRLKDTYLTNGLRKPGTALLNNTKAESQRREEDNNMPRIQIVGGG